MSLLVLFNQPVEEYILESTGELNATYFIGIENIVVANPLETTGSLQSELGSNDLNLIADALNSTSIQSFNGVSLGNVINTSELNAITTNLFDSLVIDSILNATELSANTEILEPNTYLNLNVDVLNVVSSQLYSSVVTDNGVIATPLETNSEIDFANIAIGEVVSVNNLTANSSILFSNIILGNVVNADVVNATSQIQGIMAVSNQDTVLETNSQTLFTQFTNVLITNPTLTLNVSLDGLQIGKKVINAVPFEANVEILAITNKLIYAEPLTLNSLIKFSKFHSHPVQSEHPKDEYTEFDLYKLFPNYVQFVDNYVSDYPYLMAFARIFTKNTKVPNSPIVADDGVFDLLLKATDDLIKLFSIEDVPEKFIDYLAHLLGHTNFKNEDIDNQRKRLKNLIYYYQRRGTKRSLDGIFRETKIDYELVNQVYNLASTSFNGRLTFFDCALEDEKYWHEGSLLIKMFTIINGVNFEVLKERVKDVIPLGFIVWYLLYLYRFFDYQLVINHSYSMTIPEEDLNIFKYSENWKWNNTWVRFSNSDFKFNTVPLNLRADTDYHFV